MDRLARYELATAIRGAALGQMPNIPGPALSCRELCGLIAQHWRAVAGWSGTPEEIWNSSPSGELFRVFEWGRQAIAWQARCRALPAPQ